MIRALQEGLGLPVYVEQVGARQRARMCGGAGVCGRTLCCSTFLRRMEPVSMRMARVQGLALGRRCAESARRSLTGRALREDREHPLPPRLLWTLEIEEADFEL